MAGERYAILCVDDETDLLDSLRDQLRQGLGASYLIETAEDGEEAEEVFDELLRDGYQVPVVIADYIMPRLKGDELLRRIHAAAPETKKVLLTGHATLEAMNYVIRYAGLYRYMAKPLDMEDLLMTVNEALGSYFQARKLTRFHNSLERRIEERTAELAERNAALSEAKEAAEAANRAKSEFLAGISHDLRTPLNSVLGFAELLAERVDGRQQQDYVASIRSAGRSLLTLIDDLLDLSKAEAGKLELAYRPVSLRALAEEVQGLIALRLQEKGLDFALELPPTLPEALLLDQTRMRQVLYNLVGNAVKFTERGAVTLAVECCGLDFDRSRCTLVLSVRDTGIGIPSDRLDSIFEPFEQQPGQSHSRYGGTGLGLAITRRLVGLMGGRIEVDSRVGQGSEFRVTLPAVEVATLVAAPEQVPGPVPESAPESEQEPLTGDTAGPFLPATVLVVDDVEANRRLVTDLLRPYGLDVVQADSGETAVERAIAVMPDLVLMDLNMPGVSGVDAARLLQQDPRTQYIPLVAISASTQLDELDLSEGPFRGVLAKPVGAATLVAELGRHLARGTDPNGTGRSAAGPAEGGDETGAEQHAAVPPAVAAALAQCGVAELAARESYPSVNELRGLSDAVNAAAAQLDYQPLTEVAGALRAAVERFDMRGVGRALPDLATMMERAGGRR